MTSAPLPSRHAPLLQYYVTVLLAMLALTGLLDLFIVEETERAFNIHHVIAGLGLIIFFARGRLVLPPQAINTFFGALFVISGLAAIEHGFNPMLLNAFYCFYLCLLGLLCGHLLTRTQIIQALRGAGWVIIAAITIKNFSYIGDIRETIRILQDRVYLPSVVAGGPNMEATFLLFAAVFLRGSKAYWPAFIYALFLSILYSTRAAILGCALLFAYEIIAPMPNATLLFRQFRMAGLLLAALAIGAMIISSPIAQFALSRFQDIGYEPGSEGRLVLWQTAPEVFIKHPLGVGAGNAIPEIENVLSHDVLEDNLHNIYLQILVDLGVIGFAAYAMLIWTAGRRALRTFAFNPLWLALGLYFFMGVLQFRAYDPFMFFWLGLAWHEVPEDEAA